MKKIFILSVVFLLLLNITLYAQDYKTYLIRDGDTLYNIARNFNVSVDDIVGLNPDLMNPDLIFAGDEVKLPEADLLAEDMETGIFGGKKNVSDTKEESVLTNTEAEKLLELVNAKRIENNLKPLALSTELSALAKEKCEDMVQNSYFGHDSKKHGRITDILEAKGIKYSMVGENLARNFQSAEKVFDAWINSDSHRANILYKNFDQTGIYYHHTEDGGFWVQNFIDTE